MIPSKEISVKDNRNLSFSQPKIEKSDSTDAVFGNIVAIPPQKSIKISKRPSTIAHASWKDLLVTFAYVSRANFNAGSH